MDVHVSVAIEVRRRKSSLAQAIDLRHTFASHVSRVYEAE